MSEARDGELRVRVWRGGEDGAFAAFRVPARRNQTVLDVVTWIQRHAAPDLAYRFACRVGVCGSCAVTVNGRPRWTCRTHLRAVAPDRRLTVEPLANLPRIRDLVVDMTPFFERWQRAGGRFVPTATRHDPLPRISPDSPARPCDPRVHLGDPVRSPRSPSHVRMSGIRKGLPLSSAVGRPCDGV